MNLAAALHAGERTLREAERQGEALLTKLFPATASSIGWKGWRYTAPDGIDVYCVRDSPGAVAQLHGRGFVSVTLHGHRAERLLTCTCEVHERTLPGSVR